MESKSWPARGERGAPTRCWQDREMPRPLGEADWSVRGASNGTVVGRATPGDSAARSRPERAENGCPKTLARARAQRLPGGAAPMSAGGGVDQARCVQTLGLSPAIKRDEVLTRPTTWGSLGSTHLATENKPVTKGHAFPDSIYHEKSTRGKSVERRVEEGLSGAARPGGKGVSQLKGTRFIFEVVKMS